MDLEITKQVNYQYMKRLRNTEASCKPLTKDAMELLASSVMLGKQFDKEPFTEKAMIADARLLEDSAYQVLTKRITVMGLRDRFRLDAIMGILALSDRFGAIVTAIIDLANDHIKSGKTITINEVIESFPFGFYKEEHFEYIVDNFLKPRMVSNAEYY